MDLRPVNAGRPAVGMAGTTDEQMVQRISDVATVEAGTRMVSATATATVSVTSWNDLDRTVKTAREKGIRKSHWFGLPRTRRSRTVNFVVAL